MVKTTLTMSKRQRASARRLVHIRELDGVRGIAAIMVFFHHVCFTSIIPAGWGLGVLLLYRASVWGRTGVDLFFVLSGFLITSLLIEARSQSSYYHDFYWKRALRILPLYAVCLLGVLLLIPGMRGYVVLSALFLSNFASVFHIAGDGPFWTLAIEEQFYLLWPTVVRQRSVTQVRRWAVCIGVAAVVLRLAAAAFGHFNYYLTFLHCDGLAFGAFLACRYQSTDANAAAAAREMKLLLLGVIFGAGLCMLGFVNATGARPMAFLAAGEQTGITLLYGSAIAFLIRRSGARSLAPLRSRVLMFFGLISYAMYMTHLYVLQAYDHFHGLPAPGDNSAYAARFVIVLAITIALCIASRYLLELPAMSLRKHVLAKPAPPNPAEPPVPLGNM
jgi:peptidoglycan/LPS O-acetylase OafA/YrhL